MQGKAIIFSAPSGSGKTTLVRHLLKNNSDLDFSISATTREPRGKEINGIDYHFLSISRFKSKIEDHEFIEWEEVYEGIFYGTLKSEIQKIWSAGKSVIFDVDVKGGIILKKYFGDKALSIFVKVPSIDFLEKRLIARDTETAESLEKRLYKAKIEMGSEAEFDIVLVNDDLEKSKREVRRLYNNFKQHVI